MTAPLVALLGALTLGPAALQLAHRNRYEPGPGGTAETAAMVLLAGLVTAVATARGRLDLVVAIAVFGLAAAVVDVHERRLPNTLTGALAAATGTTIALNALLLNDPASALHAVTAAGVALGVATAVKLALPAAIGWGDVKLIPALAAALAWTGPVVLYQGIVAWTLLLLITAAVWPLARVDRRETVPYGPALIAGALGTLLAAA